VRQARGRWSLRIRNDVARITLTLLMNKMQSHFSSRTSMIYGCDAHVQLLQMQCPVPVVADVAFCADILDIPVRSSHYCATPGTHQVTYRMKTRHLNVLVVSNTWRRYAEKRRRSKVKPPVPRAEGSCSRFANFHVSRDETTPLCSRGEQKVRTRASSDWPAIELFGGQWSWASQEPRARPNRAPLSVCPRIR
jgi:hypothetical protein